jgi:hypothetical protein
MEERLMVRCKKRKRLERERAEESRLTRANQEWAMDFIVDGLATGGWCILSVVDAYTSECLALEADASLGSGHVTRVLERPIAPNRDSSYEWLRERGRSVLDLTVTCSLSKNGGFGTTELAGIDPIAKLSGRRRLDRQAVAD